MEKKIYSMLNNADINLEDYEIEEFDDIEKKRIKTNFRKYIIKKKSCKRSIVACGVAIVLIVTLFRTNVGVEALTRTLKIVGIQDIASFIGIQKSIDDYKTVVNKTITNNGVTVQLNEVILDGDELTISYNVTYDKKLSEIYNENQSEVDEAWHGFNGISINGKGLNTGNGGGSRSIDDYTIQSVITYNLENIDLNGDLDIKLSCSPVQGNEVENKKSGDWGFQFKTNGDKLKIDTKEIVINKKIILENGTEYTLEKYTDNSMGQKIYASISNLNENNTNILCLKGTDDLGNKVVFYVSHSNKERALFKIENLNGKAEKLTLIPYAEDVPDDIDELEGYQVKYKPVGESFTIDLTKLK